MADPVLPLRAIKLASWVIIDSQFWKGYSWLPTYFHHLHRHLYNGQTKLNCFLFRDWIQVATLPATSTIRPSTGVSTSVDSAIAKVTNVIAALILKFLKI